jgi:hypothetical protein
VRGLEPPKTDQGSFCLLVTPKVLGDLAVRQNDDDSEVRAKEYLYGLRLCICDHDCPRSA